MTATSSQYDRQIIATHPPRQAGSFQSRKFGAWDPADNGHSDGSCDLYSLGGQLSTGSWLFLDRYKDPPGVGKIQKCLP
jgi:hypothetical protein